MPPVSPTRTSRPTTASRPNRTARRLLKVAGLGVAGFVAGLLAGCSQAPQSTLTASHPVENLENSRIPDLRHAPVPHRVHYDATKPSAGHPMPVNVRPGHYSYVSSPTNSGQ